MKLMTSWITLNNLEGGNTKRDWKENGFRKSKKLSKNNLLVCNLGTGIRLATTITGDKQQYLLKQHGQQGSGLTGTSLGTCQCQLLIPIFLMVTFKIEVN